MTEEQSHSVRYKSDKPPLIRNRASQSCK